MVPQRSPENSYHTAARLAAHPPAVRASCASAAIGQRSDAVWITAAGRLLRHAVSDGVICPRASCTTELPAGLTPRSIAVGEGSVYVAGDEPGVVHCFEMRTGLWSRLSVQAPPATALALCPDGRRLLMATRTHQIWQVDLRSGSAKALAGTGEPGLDDGVAAAASFASPVGMCISMDGRRVYVVDRDSSAVREIDLGTHYTATIVGRGVGEHGMADGNFAAARLCRPSGVGAVMTAQGERLLVTDTGNGLIRIIDPKGRTVGTWTQLPATEERGSSDRDAERSGLIAIAAVAGEDQVTAVVTLGERVIVCERGGRVQELCDREQSFATIDARSGEPLELAIGLAGLALAERAIVRLRVSSLPNGSPARTLAQRVVCGPVAGEVCIRVPGPSVHEGARWVVECESLCEETLDTAAAMHSRWLVEVRADESAGGSPARLNTAGDALRGTV